MTPINKLPLILVTNDDGINAKGISALACALKGFGEVVIVAPQIPQSGQSSAITCNIPLRTYKHVPIDGNTAFYVNGTPVDCIKLAMHTLLSRTPDLIVSGINHGSNAGVSVVYSGTMGAAFEGAILGVPSIGFSLCSHAADADFSSCVPIIRQMVQMVLNNGLPMGICLNINIPDTPHNKGIKVCRQTNGCWTQEYDSRIDPTGKSYYWLTGSFKNREPQSQETDEWALAQNYVSVVPCSVDMTAYSYFDQLTRNLKSI